MKNTALLVVDVQNDFLPPKGSLAVLGGLEILPVIREVITKFPIGRRFATQDYHPKDHCSFVENGGMWPKHCVQETEGVKIHHSIDGLFKLVYVKGIDSHVDSYSCFYDENGKASGVGNGFRVVDGIDTLFICGLATDYCVKYTVLDAIKEGFKVYVIRDAIAGVDLNEGDVAAAIEEMQKAGAVFLDSSQMDDLV